MEPGYDLLQVSPPEEHTERQLTPRANATVLSFYTPELRGGLLSHGQVNREPQMRESAVVNQSPTISFRRQINRALTVPCLGRHIPIVRP